jgi:hypothetical protein
MTSRLAPKKGRPNQTIPKQSHGGATNDEGRKKATDKPIKPKFDQPAGRPPLLGRASGRCSASLLHKGTATQRDPLERRQMNDVQYHITLGPARCCYAK